MGPPQPTNATLQLVDKSIGHLKGIVEDVLAKVEKFIFLIDFVVLDTEEDGDVLIILRHPFLNTCNMIIEVRQGKLTLRLGEENVMFNLNGFVNKPVYFASCNFIQAIDISKELV